MSLLSYTNYKNKNYHDSIMSEMTLEDLAARLDMLQQTIWSTEDRIIKNLASTAKQRADVEEIKSSLELLHQKVDKLDAEIRALRNNGEI